MTIEAGLVSITFRNLSPAAIVELVVRAGAAAIEWGGDVHVPHGNLKIAGEVGRMTQEAGLKVAAYGSYFRLGKSEEEGLSFESVLDTAVALGTTVIRVWAGCRGSAETDAAGREAIVLESRRIGDLAKQAGVTIVYEYHGGTLTDDDDSTLNLLKTVNHSAVGSLWQPRNGVDAATNRIGLKRVLPWVRHVHVFHWWPDAANRLALELGAAAWSEYLGILKGSGRDLFALLEFVPGDTPEAYLRDAAVLRQWLDT